jgi:hypothetical protein
MKLLENKYVLGFSLLFFLALGVVFGKSIFLQFYPPVSHSASYAEAPSYMYLGGGVPVYAQEAPAIIIGEVKGVGDPYLQKAGNIIPKQNVSIDVKEVLKGVASMKNVNVVIDAEKTMAGEPIGGVSFKQGEKVLLFMGMDSAGDYVSFAGPAGKYLIDENNNVISNTGEKLSMGDMRVQISSAMKALPILMHNTTPVPYSGEVTPK